MKLSPKRILALLLISAMTLSTVACATGTETDETKAAGDTGAVTEATTEYKPDIEVKNYDCDFNFVASGSSVPREVIAIEDMEDIKAGDLETAVYERGLKLKDHLGVTLVYQDAGSWIEYASNVSKTVQAGEDAYQMVLTHVYQGVTELVTSNALYDIGSLDSVNLEAPYWATELMEEVKVNDKYLIGYNDFCLADVKILVFNKDLMNQYNLTAPYNSVLNKTWTLDKLIEMASTVSADNGDGKWDTQDTYGISGWGWVPLISFVTSSDLKIVDRDDVGNFALAYENNSEKMLSLIDKIMAMYQADYSYFWKSTDNGSAEKMIKFSDGKTMFQLTDNKALVSLREDDIRFGILPYPLWDENQTEYKSLNWNGIFGVPGSIKNPDMVGDVLELMGYYTADVKTAYYEKLLGSKLAESPEDAEMLDIIWNSQVSDVGLIACNSSGQMDALVYMIPKMCEAKKANFSSYMKQNSKGAQNGLDKVFGQ
ncbi:MAG: extracellular solute-binding protein [Clostridia bacterium]|nr:extracellular solute-binding protein [Clostridia bacterium]